MRKQTWMGLTVLLLVVALTIVAACGGTTQGVTPEVGGSQASTPTKEAPPMATESATETVALTPTRDVAPTASATAASTPIQGALTATVGATETPAGLDGQALAQERCATCHGLDRVRQARKTQDGWKTTVERMVAKGAKLTSAEQDAVIEYLAKAYPQ